MKLFYLIILLCISISGTMTSYAKERDVYDESIESTRKFSLLGGPSKEGPEAEWELIQEAIRNDKLKKGIKHTNYFTRTWPDHPLAVKAQRAKGDLYFAREEYAKAFEAYQGLVDNYVGSFNYAEILQLQLECSRKTEDKVYKALFGLTRYEDPLEAVPLYRQLLTNAPHMLEAPQILYDLGEIYLREQKYMESIKEFQLLEQRYPDSPLSEAASLRSADAYAKLSLRNPTDIRPIEGELSVLNHFLSMYPSSEQTQVVRLRQQTVYEKLAELHFQLGDYYENILRRPDSALVSFRSLLQQFPDSEWTVPAKQRILELTQKEQ